MDVVIEELQRDLMNKHETGFGFKELIRSPALLRQSEVHLSGRIDTVDLIAHSRMRTGLATVLSVPQKFPRFQQLLSLPASDGTSDDPRITVHTGEKV